MADEIDSDLLKLLQSVDTPTVCNAIEVAQGKRGFSQFTRGTMISSDPEGGAIVGCKNCKNCSLRATNRKQ